MHCLKESLIESSNYALDLGDCIGVESCVDLKADLDGDLWIQRTNQSNSMDDRGLKRGKSTVKKDYPPPIPWLARTENSPNCHMPWVMKRYYTSDGRLIIKEEKMKRHEYFQAHRSNGRLTLRLVPLNDYEIFDDLDLDEDDDDDDDESNFVLVDEEETGEENGDDRDLGIDKIDDGSENKTVLENESMTNLSSDQSCMEGGAAIIGGGGGKCYNYSSVRRSPCMFGMAVPAIRPVHT